MNIAQIEATDGESSDAEQIHRHAASAGSPAAGSTAGHHVWGRRGGSGSCWGVGEGRTRLVEQEDGSQKRAGARENLRGRDVPALHTTAKSAQCCAGRPGFHWRPLRYAQLLNALR